MNAPQIIVIALFALGLLVSAAEHGKPKTETTYNVYVTVVRIGIWTGLLWWGGFFGGGA